MLSMVGFKTIGVGSRLLHTVQGGGLGAPSDAAASARHATPRCAAPRRRRGARAHGAPAGAPAVG